MKVRIKICGITNPADAEAAVRLGADAVGLNFYPGSPRCISEQSAGEIAALLPPFVEPVALVVNQSMPAVLERASRCSWMRTIQWHGDLPDLAKVANFRWIIAARIRDASSLLEVENYLSACGAANCLPAALLLDAYAPDKLGGTGHTAPWELLHDFRPAVPVILAGGLTAENVAEAIRVVRPYAVDVASGVESEPGRKDVEKMRRFVAAVRSVDSGG